MLEDVVLELSVVLEEVVVVLLSVTEDEDSTVEAFVLLSVEVVSFVLDEAVVLELSVVSDEAAVLELSVVLDAVSEVLSDVLEEELPVVFSDIEEFAVVFSEASDEVVPEEVSALCSVDVVSVA